ncbi:hypothetical protein CI102_14110 [Trichoderma harzianum]|uniref:Uncharacterized protein n=1 Tax=Trichoderma harzianum CBS 226.95 TaxID=983964 RepID=A0A2T4A8F8_TRIHA|nr:hypothetical protein M431DRAFT_461198 [Trichoderma harzianum CBS 226.95]PKK43411.1 hypothetical protein CI102_14110 [Trichoderma harzianum]PTB53360.1 hypothetical protein M431DRAFT_461198 [Trichoderma harzianum CBS 226.95]
MAPLPPPERRAAIAEPYTPPLSLDGAGYFSLVLLVGGISSPAARLWKCCHTIRKHSYDVLEQTSYTAGRTTPVLLLSLFCRFYRQGPGFCIHGAVMAAITERDRRDWGE